VRDCSRKMKSGGPRHTFMAKSPPMKIAIPIKFFLKFLFK